MKHDKLKTKYLLVLLFLVFNLLITSNISARSSYFTPAKPIGKTNGDIDTEYEFYVYSTDVGSYWKFDWGDGTTSDWIIVTPSNSYVSSTHSWSEYDSYGVRVRHMNIYLTESSWSDPLIVIIQIQIDNDQDGWINDVELSYSKDINDENDMPLDTDGDGIPDYDSYDGMYIGDTDDDNDLLTDAMEHVIGSNVQYANLYILIPKTTFYLVDLENDGKKDVFYDSSSNVKTDIKFDKNKMLLDTNGDGIIDYTYDGSLIKYEEFPWLIVILGIIIASILFIFVLFKKGILYTYEEFVIEE